MEKIFEEIETKEEEMIRELEQLVNIDSGSYTKEGIDQIIARYEQIYIELGFETEIKVNQDQGNNLVAKRQGELEGSWLFLGHADTVFPEGTVKKRPFKLDRENDRAYGPGVCDMKSGLVVLRTVLGTLISLDIELPDLVVLINGDEEIGSPTSRELIETAGREATACFVLEPGRENGDLVTARKGVGIYELIVSGRAAHAGTDHQDGISAVEELAHKIMDVHQLTDYDRGITLNVGVIAGGERPNIVADSARAEIDLRITELEQVDEIEEQLREIAAKEYLPGAKTLLKGGLNRPPMEKRQDSERIYQVFKEAASRIGFEIGEAATGGASDGNFVSGLGVPTLDALGAVGGKVHNDQEYIVVSSLVGRAKMLAGGLAELAVKE
ncbi:MAG: M20 family metallopeptidase [Halarsenatibacteraceae bacterium]